MPLQWTRQPPKRVRTIVGASLVGALGGRGLRPLAGFGVSPNPVKGLAAVCNPAVKR